MKSIFVTNAFKKDAAALAKRGYDRAKLTRSFTFSRPTIRFPPLSAA